MSLCRKNFRRALQAAGAPPPPRFYQRSAAVAALLRFDEHGGQPDVLLMRRVEHRGDPWSGQVSMPGGRSEPGDGSTEATAVRETMEEVGVDLSEDAELAGYLPPIKPLITVTSRPLRVTPVVFFATGPLDPKPLDEAQRVFWLPLDRAHAGALDGQYRYHMGPVSKTFPCWRYQDEVIWGLTYRMLRGLLAWVDRATSAT